MYWVNKPRQINLCVKVCNNFNILIPNWNKSNNYDEIWGAVHPCSVLLLLLLLLKKVGSAKLRESDVHPISPKTLAPQYQPIDRKKRKGKGVEDYSRDIVVWANKEALALLLKPNSPTPSNTLLLLLARSFQRDTDKGIKVLLYCKVLQRGGA